MALYPPAPPIIIMNRVMALLEAAPWADDAGVPDMKIRHARNRAPYDGEKPCISIGFVADEETPDRGGSARNAWETVRVLRLDLQVDMSLATEDSDLDPTGWEALMRAMAVAYDALKTQDGNGTQAGLWDYVDDIFRNDTGPDEDSSSDEGRLVQGISVIYRVSTTRPNILLADGVNYD